MVSRSRFPYSFGWLPDLTDARDYTKDTPKVKAILSAKASAAASLPKSADLRAFCPPVFDQGNLGSCTANAAAGLLEYWRKRAMGKDGDVSRLFIYKCTRDLMETKGDSGAYIRTTMGSLALFGAPPEKYWGYDALALDAAPPAFCYAYAANYQALSYYRLDTGKSGISKEPALVLSDIKAALSSGLPAMFGFRVYESIESAQNGKIPYPAAGEKILGGHAVLCVGYDDSMQIGACTGAFLIRNSWGEGWGEKGYGWLPYEYLLGGLAARSERGSDGRQAVGPLAEDWWVLLKAEWMDVEEFGV